MKQHWVPRSYLDGWCDPDTPDDHDPYVWRFGKDDREGRRKAPHNVFAETDFYTIRLPDGTKDPHSNAVSRRSNPNLPAFVGA